MQFIVQVLNSTSFVKNFQFWLRNSCRGCAISML